MTHTHRPLTLLAALSAALLLTLSSCSDNARYGALDGLWLVTAVDDAATGTPIASDQPRYMAFDMEVAALRIDFPGRQPGRNMDEYTTLYATDGHTLTLGTFRTYWQRGILVGDAEPAPAHVLALFGIDAEPTTCTWQRDGRTLTITTPTAVIHLTKH